MRPPIALTATVLAALAVAVPGTASARGTYQEGVLSYSVSGSWTTTSTVTDRCLVEVAPGETDLRDVMVTTVERGTFSSGKGTAHYQGRVGSEPFFLGNGDRPAKLTAKITRSISRSPACAKLDPEDCGTRTIKGAVTSEFDGATPITLPVRFADHPHDFDLTGPFTTCGGDGNFLNAVSEKRDGNYQDRALRYPTRASFWAHRRQTLAGTVKEKGTTFSMELKTARRTLVSKRDLHP